MTSKGGQACLDIDAVPGAPPYRDRRRLLYFRVLVAIDELEGGRPRVVTAFALGVLRFVEGREAVPQK